MQSSIQILLVLTIYLLTGLRKKVNQAKAAVQAETQKLQVLMHYKVTTVHSWKCGGSLVPMLRLSLLTVF